MAESLIDVLQAMSEAQLTRGVVLPLLRALFPDARIEETHGTIEEGRDLICFTKDPFLNRGHVLCVQVKNHKISYGATAGPYCIATLRTQAEQARRNGVVREDGDTVQPNEVWIISGHPFPAGNRKMSETFLRDISMLSGKFIDGNELVSLLRTRCGELVRELESITDSRLARTIAWLSQHHESKAFGLRLDRMLDDFHVKSRVFPSGQATSALLSGAVELKELGVVVNGEIPYADLDRFKKQGRGLVKEDVKQQRNLQRLQPFVERHAIPIEWEATIEDTLVSKARSRRTGRAEPSSPEDEALPVAIERVYSIGFDRWLEQHRAKLASAMRNLPAKLDKKTCARVGQIVGDVREVERALAEVVPLCVDLDCAPLRLPDPTTDTPHLQITDERLLLKVAPHLLVQGAPGAGKTTFSRRLAVSLLRDGVKVVYIPCSTVKAEMEGASLSTITEKCAAPGTPRAWNMGNSVVIVDGLDEAPFDLSGAVLAAASHAKLGLVATARAAFPTRLRQEFATIEISGFTAKDRNAFFAKWFRTDAGRLSVAEGLVAEHPDIEMHTRLPLIATLVAALVENNYTPTSRAEIYGQRLELLLERWETVKGLRRSTVPRKSQLRFLKHLAMIVHDRKNRSARFGWDELRQAFAKGLGTYGDDLDPDEFVRQLVVFSGVLQSDGKEFTFGHLSFQEHLAGAFLDDHGHISRIGEMLGDDWWAEVLKFYAGISQDVTELIEWCEKTGNTHVHKAQLEELVAHAPHTATVAVQVLEAS